MTLDSLPLSVTANSQRVKRLKRRIARRPFLTSGVIIGNLILLVAVAAFVISSPKSAAQGQLVAYPASGSDIVNPLDQLASASIALTVARMDNLPETTAVMNQSDSETALLSVSPSVNSVISEPQEVATDYVSNKDIKNYTVQTGDTVASIAQKFGLSANSILWSNNISGNAVTPGVNLLIPPINGIVYTVKSGDTPQSLASKFSSSKSLIIAYNDAEIGGIYPGERILIPGGSLPAAVAYASTAATYGWGSQASYGYNGYDFGYCTYWVAKLRAAAGHPLPTNLGDASTWAIRAEEFGLPVGTTPAVGAAVVLSTIGEGHVGYVTAVSANGTITISEMNHIGWDISDTRTLSGAGYEYIY